MIIGMGFLWGAGAITPTPVPSELTYYRNNLLDLSSVISTITYAPVPIGSEDSSEFITYLRRNILDCSVVTTESLSMTSIDFEFVDGEIPTGLVNGVNAVFTLNKTPYPASSLVLYVNGLRMSVDYDFTLVDKTITFVDTAIPQTGDYLVANYRASL